MAATAKRGPLFWGAFGAFGIALLTMLVWAALGLSDDEPGLPIVTQYQVAVTAEVEDEFGDLVEITTMQDQFRFGLLPDKGYDAALPIAGAFGALAVGLFLLHRRSARPNTTKNG